MCSAKSLVPQIVSLAHPSRALEVLARYPDLDGMVPSCSAFLSTRRNVPLA